MDQKMFLAIGLSMLVIVGFSFLFPPARHAPTPAPKPAAAPVTPSALPPPQEPTGDAAKAVTTERARPAMAAPPVTAGGTAKIVTVDTPRYVARFDTRGGKLVSLQLKRYRLAMESVDWGAVIPPLRAFIQRPAIDPEASVEMVKRQLPGLDTFGLMFVEDAELSRALAGATFAADQGQVALRDGTGEATLVLTGTTPQGLTVTKSFIFHADSYLLDYEAAVINYGTGERTVRVRHLFGEGAEPTPVNSGYVPQHGPIYRVEGSLKSEDPEDLQHLFPVRDPDWLGIADTYFLTAARAASPISHAFLLSEPNPVAGTKPPWIPQYGIELPVVTLAPNKQITSRFLLYFGPKKTAEMEKFGHGLETALDMRLEMLAAPLLTMLRWFYGFAGNYGVAIILLTILVRLALFPLTYKGMASMKRMQKLQPKMVAIREKYKNDKERMNREMMALYKRSKVNPLGGCLPILLQLPIFFALYSALGGAIELRHSPFIFWIVDLSAKDGLYVMPILMGASMVIQQRISPTTPDPVQAKILMWMPVIFTVFMLPFPAGLTLYWFTSNLLSILQQLVINRIKVPEPAEHPA